MPDLVSDARSTIEDWIGDFIVTLDDGPYEKGLELQEKIVARLKDLENDVDGEIKEEGEYQYNDAKATAELESALEIAQSKKDAYVDGFSYAVKLLASWYDGTNGYQTLGCLEDHFLRLQLWQIGTTDTPLALAIGPQ